MSQPSSTADLVLSSVSHVTWIRVLDRIIGELFQRGLPKLLWTGPHPNSRR